LNLSKIHKNTKNKSNQKFQIFVFYFDLFYIKKKQEPNFSIFLSNEKKQQTKTNNKGKKDYFVDGKFKLNKELIDRIPCISSNSHSSYAVNKEGHSCFFSF
jgi:N-acetyl-beta-hexosaminidase